MSSKSPGSRSKKTVVYKVTMLDDTEVPFQIDPKASGIDLINQVYDFLKLVESDYFGLEYLDTKGKKHWIDYDKSLNKQFNPTTRLYFCVKFYTPDPSQLEEEYTRYLYALQIKRDLLEGYLLCSDATASLLASYIIQAELGDYNDLYNNDPSYFNNRKFFPHQSTEHELKIMEYHKNHVGQLPGDADLNLLDIARKIEMYGVVMHSAKDHESVCLNLAVAHMGILVFQNYTKINTFSWAKIRKLSFKRKKFLIKLHPENYSFYKDTVEFYFENRDDSKAFWKKCIEYHSFFRCVSSALVSKSIKTKSLLKPRGSSYRYYGRTQKELIDLARENFIRHRTFDRSYHSMKSMNFDGSNGQINGTQSLNRNFYPISKTQPTSPQSMAKTATLRSHDTSISSHSHFLNYDRKPQLIRQQASSPNEYDYDTFSVPHDSHTIDSRFSNERVIDTDDSIDEFNKQKSPSPEKSLPKNKSPKELPLENNMNKIYSRKEVITTIKKEEIKEEYMTKSISHHNYDNNNHYSIYDQTTTKQLKLNDDGKHIKHKKIFSLFLPSSDSCDSINDNNIINRLTPTVSSLNESLRVFSSSSLSSDYKGSSSVSLSSSLASSFGDLSIKAPLEKFQAERLIGSKNYKLIDDKLPQSKSASIEKCLIKSVELINSQIISKQDITLNMIIINKLNEKNEEPLISDDDNADVLKKQSLPPMKDYLDVINIKLPKSNSYSFKDDTATDTYTERTTTRPIIKKIVLKNGLESFSSQKPQTTINTEYTLSNGRTNNQALLLDYQEPISTQIENQSKASYVIPLNIEKYDSATSSPIFIDDEFRKKYQINDEAYFIAKELLMTERTYKKDLEIILKNFYVFIESYIKSNMDTFETLNALLFINLNPIYLFHNQFSKELEAKLAYWNDEKKQKLSDILVDLNIILKNYKLYIENYDELLNELDIVCRRDKKFDALYKDFESQKICYLPFIMFILKPIQRIYHYKLLFQRLLIIFGLNHSEYKEIYNVFSTIEDLFQQINKNIYNIENKQKIIELQRELIGAESLLPLSIRVNRIFVREGSLQKLSKKGYNQRMFFLFNDVLLYCARSSNLILQFKIHEEYPLNEIQIEDGNSQINIPNSFTIYHANRSLLLSATSHDEKIKWLKDITDAIDKLKNNHSDSQKPYTSLKESNSIDIAIDRDESTDLIKQDIYDNPIELVNSNIQSQQQRANTTMHVCWHRNTSLSAADNHRSTIYQLSGYLLRKFKNSNGWQKLWVVFTNFCLFFYKTYQDDSPLASLPLLGYSVTTPSSTDNVSKEFAFKLQFKNHVYFFRAESQYSFDRWLEVIASAAQKN